MEDLRQTSYSYHHARKKKIEDVIVEFFNAMGKNKDDKISFEEFKSYMKTVGYAKYGSNENFFKKLAEGKSYLTYANVVTLLFIVNSGRPFCEKCGEFVEGLFFTCVQCFDKKKDYYYNFCPMCYYVGKNNGHCHDEFIDPVSLLRLKAMKEKIKPSVSRASLPSSKLLPGKKDDKSRPIKSNEQSQLLKTADKTSLSSANSTSDTKGKSSISKSAIVVQNPQSSPPSDAKKNLPSATSISDRKGKSSSKSSAIVAQNPQSSPRVDNSKIISSPTSSKMKNISTPSASKQIIVIDTRRPSRPLELLQIAVGTATIVGVVVEFCTIM